MPAYDVGGKWIWDIGNDMRAREFFPETEAYPREIMIIFIIY